MMSEFKFGLVHAPVTPFRDGGIDYLSYAKVLDFHIRHGAEAIAVPMHAGESVSLTAQERQQLLAFAIAHVAGRVPVIAHVSESGTAIAASLAAHARKTGAAALIAGVPYYWTPPQHMLVEHFAEIGGAGQLPLFVMNAPAEMNDVEVAPKSLGDLLCRSPQFSGLIDESCDWQYMIEVVTVARSIRPAFQFVSGTEYMISASAVGATGLLSSLASFSPRLIHNLYGLCREEKYSAARELQEDAAILFRAIRNAGIPGLKAAISLMDRDVGAPRPPLSLITNREPLRAEMGAVQSLKAEPRGWT